ncbi:MAG: DUF262 domain-containing protein [Erysipelotrichaceae bacterium]|nr:DUF262 domain-containing protein [Solobacterium sp.]MDY3793877.1 DUF262 domain-containing protein [Erysipelotrichaceae bacterium]
MGQKMLEPNLWNLEELFKLIYNVPVYQRPYSWDIEQIKVLLNDIYETYTGPDKEDGYYTGNLIIFDRNDKINGLISKYDIIDGQQRITTFSLILLAIYCKAKADDIEDRTVENVKDALWKVINRENKRECPVITLNSIEKKCFSDLFNKGYDDSNKILAYCETYKTVSKFESRVINNFKYIYDYIKEKICDCNNPEALLNYADYILQYVQFIVIEANCQASKVFSMFESINSKGKKLEEIDLIKTYIFSKLDEGSHEKYLDIWGQLIIQTNDNLYDYLSNYIKAFLWFYRQNISVDNFKTIVVRDMFEYYKVNSEAEALKYLLDDLYDKVDVYNMLHSAEEANKLVKNNKFRFYYKIFTEVAYKHPNALFLRMLVEYKNGLLNKDDVVEIVKETIGFMFKFLTIKGRDSKDVITMFSTIMRDIYENNRIIKENVIKTIAEEYINKSITTESLKVDLNTLDAYGQNKRLTIALLALIESSTEDENGVIKTSFDQAYTLLDSFSDSFSLDHLLVQTPDKNSEHFKYYKQDDGTLALKDGHDFPENVVQGMEYDDFTKRILNRIGNLRICYRDKNSSRNNTAISLKDYSNFYNYDDIDNRSHYIERIIFDECFPQPKIDIKDM